MSIGDFPEILSQQILAGIILAGGLGVRCGKRRQPARREADLDKYIYIYIYIYLFIELYYIILYSYEMFEASSQPTSGEVDPDYADFKKQQPRSQLAARELANYCRFIHIYIYIHIHTYIHICLSLSLHIYIYIYQC